MKYRKKPVVIDAIQWDGSDESADEVVKWANSPDIFHTNVERLTNSITIVTLEGVMHATAGDFIIRGVKGEYYPCKPDIFEATYDPVFEESDLEEVTEENGVKRLVKRLPRNTTSKQVPSILSDAPDTGAVAELDD